MRKLNFSKIKCVLFDLGGTLIYIANDPNFRSKYIYDRFMEINTPDDPGIPFEERIDFVHNYWMKMKADYFSRGEDFRLSEFTTGVLTALGYSEESVQKLSPLYDQIIFDYEYENTAIFDGVRDFLDYLKNREYKIGLISNTSYDELRVRKLMQKVDINKYFELVLTSADQRCSKPNPLIFQMALDYFSLKPSEAVYVGDRPEFDFEGAKNAKMQGILVGDDFDIPDLHRLFITHPKE